VASWPPASREDQSDERTEANDNFGLILQEFAILPQTFAGRVGRFFEAVYQQ
jgi:hypothetical protein